MHESALFIVTRSNLLSDDLKKGCMKGNELKSIKKEHCFVRYLTKECKGMMWKRTRNNSQYVELCDGHLRVILQKQIETATNQTNMPVADRAAAFSSKVFKIAKTNQKC